QAPRFAQPGTEGEEKRVRLELRLLADVGLVGFPNAGKSTLVSRLSRARPKIADYPFTTLQPHLGVVQYKDGRSFVLSDLPGLIEGAHRGAGLGHRFLKHMARCRTIIHLIDASQDRDLVADFDAINRELELFDPALGRKSQVVAANKIDLPEARARGEELRKKLKRRKIDVHLVSGATGEGLAELVDSTELIGPRGLTEEVLREEEDDSPAPAGSPAFYWSLLTPERKARIQSVVDARLQSVTVVLDRLLDPHNTAAVLRTAEGLGLARPHVV